MIITLRNTFISLLIYFFSLFLCYIFYYFLKSSLFSEEFLKILRDLVSTTIFCSLIVCLNIQKSISLSVDFKLILLYSSIIVLLIFLLTKNYDFNYPLHTKISAILLAPIIEEIICREIAFNSNNLFFSFILSSFLFIILHFSYDISSLIYFLFISSYLFLLRTQSASILNPIVLHSLINLVVIIRGKFN